MPIRWEIDNMRFESPRATKGRPTDFYRSGLQLLELVVSLASASMLMVGITSAMLIANRSAEIARTRQESSQRNVSGLDRLRSDLAQAYPATARTATTVALSVADRDGDGGRESILYQWLGAGNPLQMSVNSGNWQNLTDNLENFQLAWRSCQPQATLAATADLEPSPSLVYQSRTLAYTTLAARNLTVDVPTTYRANDLLVAAVSVSGNQGGTIQAPAGWTKVMERNNLGMVSLAVWYTVAASPPQLALTWKTNTNAFATIAHFRATGGSVALSNWTDFTGYSPNASSPSSLATANNSLAIRILAADGPYVDSETTNMPGHVAIAMRRQLLTNPIIGMAMRLYPAGAVPAATFGLPSNADYVTATLVFSP